MDIKAHNKFMTNKYLDTLTTVGKLRLTHPLYRKDYAFELWKMGALEDSEYSLFKYFIF